ncbi:MAG: hypothetical protein NWQ54_22375 [Paraglaciecola sp.]|uniref:hypothetical protein n=1 Tax=Pseudomonadati TaxID=3379134 RepID=UPI00273E1D41|nr:hypothetical protein [Paraglaciecola sp.]MDP5032992.1 hypothetical protein [Paraglaciecola sp.]MDP5040327.1 hypothetical protein [Paraglaciecola sp.]MDP5133639.1 hypothetical protein [Paraglaciecola sp.]
MKTVALLFVGLLSFSLYADEKPAADEALLKELKQFCTEMAEDDGIAADKLAAYLLSCVNEELESEGYAPVKKL